MNDDLYSFVYRGILTEASLDKAGRKRKRFFGIPDIDRIHQALSYEMLDNDLISDAQEMSLVYTAIHAFENTVRSFVIKAMAEKHGESWWDKVPDKIRKTVKTRMEEDAKFKYHGARGADEIMYCDFGHLSSIIVTNWEVFEDVLANMEWAKSILKTLEMSRNTVMHGGKLANEDIERIGMNIRDWIRQTG